MLNKSAFKEHFGDWWEKIEPLFDDGVMDEIYTKLKERGRKGKRIFPEAEWTYRCFTATPLSKLKVVVVGMCPYHSLHKGETVIADGLAMSCSRTNILQPSLLQWYGGIERELYNGLNLDYFQNPSLEYLAEQGVLLYNAALTTEMMKAGAHQELWLPFSKHLFENVISLTGVPVLFLGNEAERLRRYLAPMQWSFKVSHPASAAYKHTEWNSEGVFTKINKVLYDANGEVMQWLDILPF